MKMKLGDVVTHGQNLGVEVLVTLPARTKVEHLLRVLHHTKDGWVGARIVGRGSTVYLPPSTQVEIAYDGTDDEPGEERDDEPPPVVWVPAGNGPDTEWLRLLAPAPAFRDHINMETFLPGAWRTVDSPPEVVGAKWPTGCVAESQILTRALDHYGRKCRGCDCLSPVLFVAIQHKKVGWCAAAEGALEEFERVGWPVHPKVLCATHLKEAAR